MEASSNPQRNPASSLQQVPQEAGESAISEEIVTLTFGLREREGAGRELENMVDAFKGEDAE
jgi:hypothetical protein